MMSYPNIRQFFDLALSHKASDIFLAAGAVPALKINGDVVPIEGTQALTEEQCEKYLLEIMGEKQKQSFEHKLDLDFSINIDNQYRFRVNTFVQDNGVAAVFRPIPDTIPSLAELRLPESLQRIAKLHNGLVLITGKVGCGKSSTLAALVDEINRQQYRHIVTIEDPIEFKHYHQKSLINQREVGTHTTSFQQALRACLREAADVIMLGEMRDYETISLALTAAETGSLVLATLHTAGAAKTIDRIIDVFPAERQNQARMMLSESLRTVVWQQLIKTENGAGRVPACEILFNNTAIANMIRKGNTHQIDGAIETGGTQQMQTMKQSLDQLLAQQLISETAYRSHLPLRLTEG